MSDFDSLCDCSAFHTIADADALWRATMDVAVWRPTAMATQGIASPVCLTCEGDGWECYGLGRGDPHFRVCSSCGNPEGRESP